MTDWENDDALREALIAEIAAEMPAEMRPGDVTIPMLAEQLGITESKASYTLKKMERAGRLISVRANVPGARGPLRVWRKPV